MTALLGTRELDSSATTISCSWRQLGLVCVGLLVLYSASFAQTDSAAETWATPLVNRSFRPAGITASIVLARFDYRLLKTYWFPLYLISCSA